MKYEKPEEKKRLEEEKKRKELDALIGGVSNSEGTQTGGEGPDNQAGDKGQLDGDPYAPSYFGQPGSWCWRKWLWFKWKRKAF